MALKRATFKQSQMTKRDEDKEKFREANRASRKAVRIAKGAAYEDLYAKLDSREGIKMVYKLANTRERRLKDILDNAFHQQFGRPNTHCRKRDHKKMADVS